MKEKWSMYELTFLEANFETMTNKEISEVIGKTPNQIAWKMIREGWRRSSIKHWTKKELDWLRANAHLGEPGLAKALGINQEKIRAVLRNHKIRTGNPSRFQKGMNPWNAGKKIRMSPASEFKKGMQPHNTKYNGYIGIRYEKITHKPYQVIRIGLKKWELLSRHTWRQHFGEIPEGMLVAFKDGNAMNCQPENLMLLTRRENLLRNINRRKQAASIAESWDNGTRYENNEWIARLISRGDKQVKEELLKHPELLEAKRQQLLLRRQIKQQLKQQAR